MEREPGSMQVCVRQIERQWDECVSVFSPGCLEMFVRGRVGCGSIIRCGDPCAVFHPGALGSLSMCVLVGKGCVYMTFLGVSKLLRWRCVSLWINVQVWIRIWSKVCIFSHPAIRKSVWLLHCYYACVCVCVVFAKMDADFKTNFPSRRRASSSKTPLSGKYMHLQKNKFLWNDERSAHFLIDNHVFLKSHVGGWPGFKGPRVTKFTQLINDHVSVQTQEEKEKTRKIAVTWFPSDCSC